MILLLFVIFDSGIDFFEKLKDESREENMYQKTGQRNLKSLEVHFSCQERVNFHMKIN